MTPGGRKKTQRAIVVVGNKNGVAGKILHWDLFACLYYCKVFFLFPFKCYPLNKSSAPVGWVWAHTNQ